jgi:hypothetical protein
VFQRVNNAWQNIAVSLKHVSVGADGTVWGVNASDEIFQYVGGQRRWQKIDGKLKQISVGSASQVWGVNASNQVFQRVNNAWQNRVGGLTHVSVGADGTVWGVYPNNEIYRHKGNNKWDKIDGKLKQISVGSASQIWGVNASNQVFQRVNNTWQNIAVSLKYVSVGADGTVWGVNANDDIFVYTKPVTQPAEPTTGQFQVPTNSVTGFEFTNKLTKEATYKFTPSGTWKPKADIPDCTAAGLKGFAPEIQTPLSEALKQFQENLKYPNNTTFALLAVNKTTGNVSEVGKETTIVLKPGETLTFLVNDFTPNYGDNTGTLTVKWSAT